MKIKELKQNLDFYVDSIFQEGYDLGFDSAIKLLDHYSNMQWNEGNKVTAEVIRQAIKNLGDM